MGAMTVMEVVLEGAMKSVTQSPDFSCMAMLVTLGQFLGCLLLALPGGACNEAPQQDAVSLRERFNVWLPYIGLACLVWCATGLANLAVSWVQYPVKVVFKSSKLIPTMLVSVFMGNSRPFTAVQYLAAMMLCAGTAGFSMNQGAKGTSDKFIILGITFLILAVFSDAIVANFQQRLMQRRGVPPMLVMFRLNVCGVLVSSLTILLSGRARQSIDLMIRQPNTAGYVAGVGASIAIGVWANTQLINEAGSVLVVGVATVRKVLTMILSYCIFPKPLSRMQVISSIVVLCGIIIAERDASRPKDASSTQTKSDHNGQKATVNQVDALISREPRAASV